MRLESINRRYVVKSKLARRPSHDELLVEDRAAGSHLQVLALWLEDAHGPETAFEQYNRLRNSVCPPLIRPRELHRVLTIDGMPPPCSAWVYTRPYVVGNTLEGRLSSLTPAMLMHLLESELYLSRSGHGVAGLPLDSLVVEAGTHRLRLANVAGPDEGELMDRVSSLVEENALAGGELSELSALIRDGRVRNPSEVIRYLAETHQPPPAAQFSDTLPPRLQGYHRQLLRANACFMRDTDGPPVVVIREGEHQRAGDMIWDLLARAEVRGWFSVLLGNAGAEDLEGFITRRLAENLSQWAPFSSCFSEGDLWKVLDACGSVHPLCLCMTLRKKHEKTLPELVQRLQGLNAGGSVSLVLRLRSDVLPGRVEMPGCTISLASRQPPAAGEIVSALLAADEPPQSLLIALERYGVVEPEELLVAVRYLIFRGLLLRQGAGWCFSMSRREAQELTDADVPLLRLLKLEGLSRTALAALVHAGHALGARMVAHTIDADPSTVEESLQRLEEEGLVSSVTDRRKTLWRAARGVPESILLPPWESVRSWDERMLQFSLSHPSPALSELMAAIDRAEDEPELRGSLLYSALNIAGDYAGSGMTGRLLHQLLDLPAETLSANQMRRVLERAEPTELDELDPDKARGALNLWMERLPSGAGRILALLRLGELDRRDGDDRAALGKVRSALAELSRGEEGLFELSLCLRLLSEMDGSGQSPPAGLEEVNGALKLVPADAPPSRRMTMLSHGALALAIRGEGKRAEKMLARAGTYGGSAGPDAKQILEWSRGRVLLELGRNKPAAEALEKALLLAEHRGDQRSVERILGRAVMCQERLPGYTLRGIASNMERITAGRSRAGSPGYGFHSLSRLYCLYVRSLRLSKAKSTSDAILRLEVSEEEPRKSPAMEWLEAFIRYQTGHPPDTQDGNGILPGTGALLVSLHQRTDPLEEAKAVARAIESSNRRDVIALGLYLAMETAARGWTEAAASMASALTSVYRPRMEEVIPAWRLCINALLASNPREAEKSLATAQIMCRQLDRLLLLWLVLQVRISLELKPQSQREAELLLLLEEIDQHVESQLESGDRARFRRLERVSLRRERCEELGGPLSSSLDRFRDRMAESLDLGGSIDLSVLSGLPEVTPRTSSVSWGMEALRAVSRASRVQVISVLPDAEKVLESRGFGAESPPSPEAVDSIREKGGAPAVLDNFGQTPFGSRFIHVIPLDKTPAPLEFPERRSSKKKSVKGNYLLIEVDSPFDTLGGSMGKMLRCFSRQISASLSLRELEEQTCFDSMTGAFIRGVWLGRLREMLESDVRSGKELAVLMIDLDYFKAVNDSFGHREGDHVLKAVVDSIVSALRPNDVVGRLGGEEFGVILPGASEGNAMMVAERVRRRVESSVFRPDRRAVTISLGISCAPSQGKTAELLVRRADVALYESKNAGRNRSTMWDASMSSTFRVHDTASLLDTGDPGWDQLVSNTVMRLLAERSVKPELALDDLRNALRCEYLMLEDTEGRGFAVGPAEIGELVSSARFGQPGTPQEDMSGSWQYYTLATRLASGGKMLAAWPADESRPRCLPILFRSMTGLVEMLLASGRLGGFKDGGESK